MQRLLFTGIFILFSICGFGQIISDFSVNAEGWTVYATSTGTSTAPTYTSSGGNPAGSGEISFSTVSPAVGFYFSAPAKFLGDVGAAYNQNLSFDLHTSYPGSDNSIGDLIITNSVAGASLYYQLPGKPPYMGYFGSTYTVQLVETFAGWHYGSLAGPTPTSAQVKLVLGNVTSLRIREKYFTGNTFTVNGYLDNVILGIAPPSITSQPVTPQTVCGGTNVLLSTSATGNPSITYHWQMFDTTFGQYFDLTNNSTYSGVTTSTLTINTTGNVGAGTYRCRVSGSNAPDVTTNNAVVNVNSRPNPPTTTGAARCSPSTVPLSASGASNGQYRWYTISTGGSAIIGQTNSTYTTPSLTSTTIYYVAINNGTCESLRTSVTATINIPPAAPTATGASSCSAAALTLSASGGSAGQYRWYTVSSGGTAISAQTNSTYTTPVLSASTTYYVSINNGTCESSRAGVTATIATPPSAPTTTGASGCPSITMILNASGGVNGQYRWYLVATGGTAITGEVNNVFTTPSLTTTTTYFVAINNGTCESSRASVTATVQTCTINLPPTIASTTVQTTIEGKVTVNLVSLVSDPDNNLDLSTLKVIVQPLSGAKASIDAQRNLILDYTGISFSGKEKLTLEVCDLLGACSQQEIAIDVVGDIIVYNGISPNGDMDNDFFYIEYIDVIAATKKNHVFIYNRWGDVIFDVADYDNKVRVFKGLNNNGNDVTSGTYFYKIEFASGKETMTGYLSLKR